ncbi:MAG: glycosyl hydrolase [Longimicrobiales bacterium]
MADSDSPQLSPAQTRLPHQRRARLCALVALAGSLTLGSPQLKGQARADVDPTILDTWQWRALGPNLGGRSIAVAGSAARELEYYFGAVGGGLWKTTDAGNSWRPVSDGWFMSSSVGSIGVCEADPDVVYVGMGEGQFRGTMSSGDGAYATRDGGETWSFIGLASSTGQTMIPRMRVDPANCDVVYAAVLGDPYGPNEERGVFRSTDGGSTWERVLFVSELAGASDLAMDPADPNTMYATIWDVHRPPWGGRTSGTSGVFKSTNGGDSWTDLTRNPGMPDTIIGKVGISVSGADSNRLYAVIEAAPDHGGVFRSDNAGATWRRTNGNNALFHRAEYYTRITADTQDPDRLYVLNKNFFRSDDGGETFQLVRVPHGDNHDLWIAPDDNARMVQANDGGGTVSWNAGETWTDIDFPTAQMYHAFVTNDFPYQVCGAQQDNTSKCVPSDGDGSFWYQGPGGEQGYVAIDPTRTTLGYGGSQRGGITRFDRTTGQRQNVQIWPRQSDGFPAGGIRERFQWTFPIVMSLHDPRVIYAASQHVWKTEDAGENWQRISPDLTLADPETLTGSEQPIKDHNSQDYYATIFTLAVSPHDAQTLWTGSDDGLIHVSRDGGANWQDVTPEGLPFRAKASLIEVSPHTPGKAYLAAEKYKLQDVRPYIFKTEDYGETWELIVNGIGADHFVRAVKEDPERAGLLYAGTEHAPYVSFNDGAVWQPIALNLPDLQISDIEVAGNDLVVSTYGRGFYTLEGIDSWRQMTADLLASDVHLYEPGAAIRTRAGPASGVDRAVYGRGRISGTNRVDIYYQMRSGARRVTIDILTERGDVVRSFVGAPDVERPRPARNSVGHVITGPSWGGATPAPIPGFEAGFHRFSWDTRYPPAADFPGMRLRGANADGPQATPGTYQVRLTVDGVTRTERFDLLKDPRLTEVTQADFVAQFDLAMAVHARFNDATMAVTRIRALRGEVDDRVQSAADVQVTQAGTALATNLRDVEGDLYEGGAEAQSDLKHFGTRLANHLSYLKGVVMGADARPTQQSFQVLEEISVELDAHLERLELILGDELDRFNDLLREKGLPPVGRLIA